MNMTLGAMCNKFKQNFILCVHELALQLEKRAGKIHNI